MNNIIIGCKNRDEKAQTALYHEFSPRLFGVCLRYLKSRAEAEDILQDAFIRIYKKIDLLNEGAAFYPWAKRLTINIILRHFEKKNALREAKDVDEPQFAQPTPETVTSGIAHKELLGLLDSLPTGKRTVFNLYVIEGYSHKEIAEKLNISEGTSKSQLAKAKQMLREVHVKLNEVYV